MVPHHHPNARTAPPPQPRERISFVLSDVQRREDQRENDATPPPQPRAPSPPPQPPPPPQHHLQAAHHHHPQHPQHPQHPHHPQHPQHPQHLPSQALHQHPHHTHRRDSYHREAVEVAAALEYRDASRQRASSSQYYSQDCDARTPHEPPLLPVSMPPVPALPQRRGPSCVCSLACIALLGCLSFSACFFLQLSYLNLDVGGGGAVAALQRRRDYARHMRQQQHKLGTSTPQVRLGLWDENLVVTPLQLTVALSLALGVDERSIRVVEKGSHFFNVLIDGEGDWLVETINAAPPASSFFHVLNAQAAVFGARLVVSNQAVLVAPNGTAANPDARYEW